MSLTSYQTAPPRDACSKRPGKRLLIFDQNFFLLDRALHVLGLLGRRLLQYFFLRGDLRRIGFFNFFYRFGRLAAWWHNFINNLVFFDQSHAFTGDLLEILGVILEPLALERELYIFNFEQLDAFFSILVAISQILHLQI